MLEAFEQTQTRSLAVLHSQLHPDSLMVFFQFPEEIKVPCEQYLLYFVNFLSDLGLQASADITHEAGNVLFRITPENKEEALDKIREALSVYLNLPKASNLSREKLTNIEMQQLVANVQHLQTQLLLASAILESKNATIESQNETLRLQRRVLDAQALSDSIQYTSSDKKVNDKEEFLGGTIALTKYEGKGFEINLAEIYRWGKSLFKK